MKSKRSAKVLPADLCTDHAHYVHRSTVLRRNENMAVEGGTVSHYFLLVITVARRDKTLPRIQKHFPESKTLPRIQKHVPESKTLPRIQKHVPESRTRPRIQNTSQNPKHFPESEHTSQNPKNVPESRYQKYTLYSLSFIARIQGGFSLG